MQIKEKANNKRSGLSLAQSASCFVHFLVEIFGQSGYPGFIAFLHRRVSGRKNPAALDTIGRTGETCQTGGNIDNKKLVSDGNNASDKKEFVLDAEDHINNNVQSKRFIYLSQFDDLIIYILFQYLISAFILSFGLFLLQVLCRKAVCQL